jgi:hypothetical protein
MIFSVFGWIRQSYQGAACSKLLWNRVEHWMGNRIPCHHAVAVDSSNKANLRMTVHWGGMGRDATDLDEFEYMELLEDYKEDQGSTVSSHMQCCATVHVQHWLSPIPTACATSNSSGIYQATHALGGSIHQSQYRHWILFEMDYS